MNGLEEGERAQILHSSGPLCSGRPHFSNARCSALSTCQPSTNSMLTASHRWLRNCDKSSVPSRKIATRHCRKPVQYKPHTHTHTHTHTHFISQISIVIFSFRLHLLFTSFIFRSKLLIIILHFFFMVRQL